MPFPVVPTCVPVCGPQNATQDTWMACHGTAHQAILRRILEGLSCFWEE